MSKERAEFIRRDLDRLFLKSVLSSFTLKETLTIHGSYVSFPTHRAVSYIPKFQGPIPRVHFDSGDFPSSGERRRLPTSHSTECPDCAGKGVLQVRTIVGRKEDCDTSPQSRFSGNWRPRFGRSTKMFGTPSRSNTNEDDGIWWLTNLGMWTSRNNPSPIKEIVLTMFVNDADMVNVVIF